jgi:hypothetical protein
MPRKGPAYPITPEWQGWVADRLKELHWKPADLVRESGVSKASISKVLNPGAVQTTVMREIHKALKWPPPLMTPPIYILELVDTFQNLSDLEQGRWLERFRNAADAEKKARR